MDITLYSFSKRANSTKRPSGGVTVSGYLREGADLRSPSFILSIPPDQLSTYMSYNYAQVLGQYYYVGDMINRSATEWEFVEDTFGGSLPAFMAAFTKRKQLTDSDIAEIQRMIQQMGRE